MNYINLGDLLYFNAGPFKFMIEKEEYGSFCHWKVINMISKEIVEKGKCNGMTRAKAELNVVYRKLKPAIKSFTKGKLFILNGKIYG